MVSLEQLKAAIVSKLTSLTRERDAARSAAALLAAGLEVAKHELALLRAVGEDQRAAIKGLREERDRLNGLLVRALELLPDTASTGTDDDRNLEKLYADAAGVIREVA